MTYQSNTVLDGSAMEHLEALHRRSEGYLYNQQPPKGIATYRDAAGNLCNQVLPRRRHATVCRIVDLAELALGWAGDSPPAMEPPPDHAPVAEPRDVTVHVDVRDGLIKAIVGDDTLYETVRMELPKSPQMELLDCLTSQVVWRSHRDLIEYLRLHFEPYADSSMLALLEALNVRTEENVSQSLDRSKESLGANMTVSATVAEGGIPDRLILTFPLLVDGDAESFAVRIVTRFRDGKPAFALIANPHEIEHRWRAVEKTYCSEVDLAFEAADEGIEWRVVSGAR